MAPFKTKSVILPGLVFICILFLLLAGWSLRYEPVSEMAYNGEGLWVWDRWGHQLCFTPRLRGSPICKTPQSTPSMTDLSNSVQQIVSAIKQSTKETPDKPDFIKTLRADGFSDGQISMYLFWLRDQIRRGGAPDNLIDAYLAPIFLALQHDSTN